MKPNTLSPRKATTEKKLCSLQRDNKDFAGRYNIMISEDEIFLSDQKLGESPTQSFAIPRKHFNQIIDWYNKEQKSRKP